MTALKNVKAVVVLDRNPVAAVYHDLRSAMFGQVNPPMVLGRIAGLGGRDVTFYDVMYMAEEALEATRRGYAQRQHAWHFETIEDEDMLAQALSR